MSLLFFYNLKEMVKVALWFRAAGMVCAVLVWQVVHDCCQKDFFANNSCRALAEIVQILNELSGSQSYVGYSYLLCAVYVLIIPVSTPVTFLAATSWCLIDFAGIFYLSNFT